MDLDAAGDTDQPVSAGPGDSSARTDAQDGASDRSFRHEALLYDSPEELAAVAGPFLLDGLAAGDGAVIAVSTETVDIMREAVNNDPLVLVLERRALYRSRTPTALKTFRALSEQAAPGRWVRVVGEVDFGTTAADQHEWQRYEAVINEAFAAAPLWGLCVFDARRSSDAVLDTARRTHPHLVTASSRTANRDYTDPAAYLGGLSVPDEPLERTPPAFAAEGITDFGGLRHTVAGRLREAGVHRDLAEDYLLAVDEMASNALRHGQPPASLRLWITPETLVCTIGDAGAGPIDPFAGYGPAHGEDLSRGGMGLWLARQLCDHVALRHDERGNSIRLTTHRT